MKKYAVKLIHPLMPERIHWLAKDRNRDWGHLGSKKEALIFDSKEVADNAGNLFCRKILTTPYSFLIYKVVEI